MSHTKHLHLTIISPLVLLSCVAISCSPVYYAPNTHNVPLLQKKNEGVVGLHVADQRGELQAAFALTDRLGIMMNVAAIHPKNDEDGDGGKGDIFEFGGGYFGVLRGKFMFESYAMLGFGNLENHFPSTLAANPFTTGKIKGQFLRYAVQPSIGFKSSYFDAALSLRMAELHYSKISGNLTFGSEDQVQYLEDHKNHFLLEPALTVRGGFDYLKLQIQLGLSHNLTTPNFRQNKGYLTVGLLYNWN